MNFKIEKVNVEQQYLASIRKETKFSELSKVIPELLNRVYSFIKTSPIKNPGLNAVLYLDNIPTIEAGVIVSDAFENTGEVNCNIIPGGLTLRAVHTGPYIELPGIHELVHQWAAENEIHFKGRCWEIYDHWNDDPSKLRTEVYYLIKER